MLKPGGAGTARSAMSTGDATTARAAETRATIDAMNIISITGLLANQRPEASEVPTSQKVPAFYTIRATLADTFDRPGQVLLTGSGRRCPPVLADAVQRVLGRAMSRASLDF